MILMESNSYYFKCVARHKAFLNISSTSKVSKPKCPLICYGVLYVEADIGSDIKV